MITGYALYAVAVGLTGTTVLWYLLLHSRLTGCGSRPLVADVVADLGMDYR